MVSAIIEAAVVLRSEKDMSKYDIKEKQLVNYKNKTWLLEVFYEPEYVINDERYPGNANQF